MSPHGRPARRARTPQCPIRHVRFVPARAVALLTAVGLLLGASQARSYCREVAADPPANYDPTTSGCFVTDADGAALPPLFWRNQCVSYSFQADGSGTISVADTARIANQAFAAWSNAPCPDGGTPSILADPYPEVECDSAESQGHNNVILFRNDGWPYDSANALGDQIGDAQSVEFDAGGILP